MGGWVWVWVGGWVSGCVCVGVCTVRGDMYCLQPEDLGVSLPLLELFQSGARKRLSEEEMEGRRCYILPKYVCNT